MNHLTVTLSELSVILELTVITAKSLRLRYEVSLNLGQSFSSRENISNMCAKKRTLHQKVNSLRILFTVINFLHKGNLLPE